MLWWNLIILTTPTHLQHNVLPTRSHYHPMRYSILIQSSVSQGRCPSEHFRQKEARITMETKGFPSTSSTCSSSRLGNVFIIKYTFSERNNLINIRANKLNWHRSATCVEEDILGMRNCWNSCRRPPRHWRHLVLLQFEEFRCFCCWWWWHVLILEIKLKRG